MDRLMCYFDDETAVPRGCCTFDRESDTEPDDCISCGEICEEKDGECRECPIQKAFNKLAEYENLEEQRLLQKFPCWVGKVVWVIARCEDVYMYRSSEENTSDCPYEDDCEWDECNDRRKRIFQTTVESLSDEGYGWFVTLKHIAGDFSINEFGKTVFSTQDQAEKAYKEMEVQE